MRTDAAKWVGRCGGRAAQSGTANTREPQDKSWKYEEAAMECAATVFLLRANARNATLLGGKSRVCFRNAVGENMPNLIRRLVELSPSILRVPRRSVQVTLPGATTKNVPQGRHTT